MIVFDLQVSLCQALRERRLPQVRESLLAGAKADWCPPVGGYLTPMEEAAAQDFIAGLDALYAAGGNVNFSAHRQQTPLMIAASVGAVEAGRWLLRHGADECALSDRKRTALCMALREADLDFANMLLEERPETGKACLEIAAQYVISFMDVKVAEWLLGQGVSPGIQTPNGIAWLLVAQAGKDEVRGPLTDLLIEAGADVNQKSNGEMTPLLKALEYQRPSDFFRLLRAGADPDLPGPYGKTARQIIHSHGEGSAISPSLLKAWESSCVALQAINILPVDTLKSL